MRVAFVRQGLDWAARHRRLVLLAVGVAALSVVWHALIWLCSVIKVREYQVDAPEGLSAPLRIVQISDFHSNDFGRDERRLLDNIRAARPDVVMLTGDIFDYYMAEDKPVENVRLLLEGIRGLCPFYFVAGNHEFYHYHRAEFSELVEEYGGTILKDDVAVLDVPQGRVVVAGIYDPFMDLTSKEKKKRRPKIRSDAFRARLEAVAGRAQACRDALRQAGEEAACTVLLSHRPEYAADYSRYPFDLVLAGHAHGGQWRIPGMQRGVYAPDQGLFPRYSGGRFDLSRPDGGTQVLVVSRGLSWQAPRVPRFFNPPELVVVEVR